MSRNYYFLRTHVQQRILTCQCFVFLSDEMQGYKVRFEPKSGFITVSIGNSPTPFVLNPGRWQFSIKSDQYLLVVNEQPLE